MNSVVAFPAPLPDTSSAPLPQVHEAAQAALATLDSVDECKTWADKASALASYAKQAKDDSLRVIAVRIQARAERRAGELLKQIDPAPGARTDLGPMGSRGSEMTSDGQAGALPPVTRTQAATDAGLSDRQRKTALRTATVPAAAFDAQVESPRPPSITHLASQGTVPRTWQPPMQPLAQAPGPAQECNHDLQLATKTLKGIVDGSWNGFRCTVCHERWGFPVGTKVEPAADALAVLVRFCETNEPTRLARASSGHEVVALRRAVGRVERWLREFAEHLPAG
jgi:hypothetical protein